MRQALRLADAEGIAAMQGQREASAGQAGLVELSANSEKNRPAADHRRPPQTTADRRTPQPCDPQPRSRRNSGMNAAAAVTNEAPELVTLDAVDGHPRLPFEDLGGISYATVAEMFEVSQRLVEQWVHDDVIHAYEVWEFGQKVRITRAGVRRLYEEHLRGELPLHTDSEVM